jgi:AGZA family xanthine/uracil permease-like MFS transporter
LLAVVCVLFALSKPQPRVPDAEELALERLHSGETVMEGNEFTEAPEGGVPASVP